MRGIVRYRRGGLSLAPLGRDQVLRLPGAPVCDGLAYRTFTCNLTPLKAVRAPCRLLSRGFPYCLQSFGSFPSTNPWKTRFIALTRSTYAWTW